MFHFKSRTPSIWRYLQKFLNVSKKIQYDSALIKFPEMDVKMPPYTSVMLTPYNIQYSTYFPPPFF